MDFKRRIDLLEKSLIAESLDALLVTNEKNVLYLSGFRGHDSLLLITRKASYFITDFRYIEEAKHSIKGFEFVLVKESTCETMGGLAKDLKLKRIGFESMNLPYEAYARLRSTVKNAVRLKPFKGIVEALRKVKDKEESLLIKKAARLTAGLHRKFKGSIKNGEKEEELSSRVKLAAIRLGTSCAFEPIIAVDANASRPHAVSRDTKVTKDCVIMADFGVSRDGYNADMTRTILRGAVSEKVRRIYDIVRKAQELAIKMVRPGVKISSVDDAARGFIKSRGFGGYFGHALGHGIGLDVHEDPSVSRHNHMPLKEGMVLTIEPAVYIPKLCGVRIEDMVLVTKTGCEVLTD